MALTDDVATVLVGTVGLNGESADAARMTAIEGEQTAINDRLDAFTLGDLTDVDTATTPPADGDTLVYVLADDEWVPGNASGAIAFVKSYASGVATTVVSDADRLQFGDGLTTAQDGTIASQANVTPTWGGTGTKNLVAHSDHTHTTPTTTPVLYTSKGTLSSGSVTLVSTNVTLPAAGAGEVPKVYKVTVRLRDTQTGLGGSSYYVQKITIGGTVSTSWSRRTVGGVPLPSGYEYTREITGAGTSVPIVVELAYSSGDPMTVEAGAVYIDVNCNR